MNFLVAGAFGIFNVTIHHSDFEPKCDRLRVILILSLGIAR